MKKLLAAIIAGSFLLTACNTMEGLGRDVEKTGDKLIFQLVMPEDADAAKGLISTTSPIGRAFLNKEEGDSVKVTTPGGTREFEIIKLLTIHDEAAANASNANS